MMLSGLLIGFYSYIMINNINLAIIELSIERKYGLLVLLIVTAIIFEALYCYFCLSSLGYLNSHLSFIKAVKIISIILLLILGIWSIVDSRSKSTISNENITRRAFFSIILHAQQIPFWLIWGNILFSKHWIEDTPKDILSFTFYNVIGSVLVLLLYVVIGKYLQKFITKYKVLIVRFVGLTCILFAVSELSKIIFKFDLY